MNLMRTFYIQFTAKYREIFYATACQFSTVHIVTYSEKSKYQTYPTLKILYHDLQYVWKICLFTKWNYSYL